jgi:hypothetical protein
VRLLAREGGGLRARVELPSGNHPEGMGRNQQSI